MRVNVKSRAKIIWIVVALRQAALRDRGLYSEENWHQEACLLELARTIMGCQTIREADHELRFAARVVREQHRAPHLAAKESIEPLSEASAIALADEIRQICNGARTGVRPGRVRRTVLTSARSGKARRTLESGGDVLVLGLALQSWADANRRLRPRDHCGLVEDKLRWAAALAVSHGHFGDAQAQVYLTIAESANAWGPGYAGTGGAPVRIAARHILQRLHRVFEIAHRYEYSPDGRV